MLIIIIIIFGNKSRRPRAIEYNLYGYIPAAIHCAEPVLNPCLKATHTRGNLAIICFIQRPWTVFLHHRSQWFLGLAIQMFNVRIRTRAHHRLLCSRW